MLIVQKPAAGPAWQTVLSGRFLFAPIDRPMIRRARRAALNAIGADDRTGGDEMSVADQLAELGDALSLELLVAGIIDWDADTVCVMVDGDDTGKGEPLPFSVENRAMLLADALTFDALDAAYVMPYAARERQRAAPGNASAVSPNTTGETAMPAKTIVASAAVGTTSAAKRARTSNTKRRPKPRKTSGAS